MRCAARCSRAKPIRHLRLRAAAAPETPADDKLDQILFALHQLEGQVQDLQASRSTSCAPSKNAARRKSPPRKSKDAAVNGSEPEPERDRRSDQERELEALLELSRRGRSQARTPARSSDDAGPLRHRRHARRRRLPREQAAPAALARRDRPAARRPPAGAVRAGAREPLLHHGSAAGPLVRRSRRRGRTSTSTSRTSARRAARTGSRISRTTSKGSCAAACAPSAR